MTSLTIHHVDPSPDNTLKVTSTIRAIASDLDGHPRMKYSITGLGGTQLVKIYHRYDSRNRHQQDKFTLSPKQL
jgi:hypothetical protein